MPLNMVFKSLKIFIQITLLLKVANFREFINGSMVQVLQCMKACIRSN